MIAKKANYHQQIIKHLYFAGSLSCAELSILIKKSVPLTAKVLNELMESDFVLETGLAESTGGRRAQKYELNAGQVYIIAVAMDQLITRVAILDMHHNFVGDVKKIELKLANNPNALTEIISNIQGFIKASGISKEKFAGIGISMPGFIDVKKGINYSFLKTLHGESINACIENALKIPVLIDNDSSIIALTELKMGRARGKKNAMVINVGWGVGLGMILNAELYRGQNGFAGEFSHIPMFNNNKLCSCGKTGCLETETSLQVLIEKAKEGLKGGRLSGLAKDFPTGHYETDYEMIIDAALKGDQFAVELFSDAGYNIGRGIAILIHLLNPEIVILSGLGAFAGKMWEAPIQQALNKHCIPRLAENTVIEVSKLGYNAALYGAAALVMENKTIDYHPHSEKHKQKKILLIK
ncbi:MAG: ROK family protein [Bacteroidetes bacterium]|nr:ROK family protein [Bacteroidota bacterium]MBS1757998.1 ROK family protein [Bacteroidota bacterium]